jgi:hypothetical protein
MTRMTTPTRVAKPSPRIVSPLVRQVARRPSYCGRDIANTGSASERDGTEVIRCPPTRPMRRHPDAGP